MENNPTYVEHSENPVETAGTQGEDIVAQSMKLPPDLATLSAILQDKEQKTLRNFIVDGIFKPNMGFEHPESKLIQQYSFNGLTNGRPLDCGIIVVAGESGSGKSMTINKLFEDDNLCAVSDESSQTTEVTKYIKKLLVTDVGPPQISADLVFVDVPGSLDSDRTNETGNFAKILQFRNGYKSLKKRGLPIYMRSIGLRDEVFSNTVLFTFNAPNTRMKGKDTGFVKSLQILKKQNLVDNKHPNLILVGTHAAGLGLKPEKYIQNTNRIQKLVKELVLENVGINDVPVVFVENLPEDFNLDKPGDFFLLPDDSLNHANLLQEMFNLFTKTNDTLCRLLVSWYFSPTCPDRDDDPEVDTENESIELGVEAAEQLKEINQLMMDLNIGVKPIPSETVQDETHRGTQTVKAATEVKDTKAQSPTTAASPTATIAIIQPTTRIGMSSAGITTAKQTPTNESSCFPSWTRIVTKTGPKFMHELQVGEHLITMTHNGGQRWSQCYGFAHHDSNRVSKFLKLRLSNGYTLTVTEDHLMIICNEVDVLKYKTARYIKEGDVLFCQNGFVNIIKIGEEICSGVYCPLTTDGTLLADGVLVTCYADTDNFHLAHAAFAPLRIWYKLTGSSGTIGEGGIHKYAKSLMKIRNCFMPAKLQ